jgi:hypothetical protein
VPSGRVAETKPSQTLRSRSSAALMKANKAHLSTGSTHASWGKAYGFRLLVYARSGLFGDGMPARHRPIPRRARYRPGTAEMVAETREAIRKSQQTIDETRELMRRLDLVIERERVLKRT